ncbi:ABC transporter substrate-binding protein [Phreatobacter aquaticus]|uniref:ABC transporter substrate-binding protein n=1 Tax=Phreatobacter aquaticus TaxID=2570229 RepID=A0A4D7QLX0_9HYPH|nr:ABC transporter substrate-binding protein [Phreatobacter aquaticus]QCK86396.1 ABC transporter substrate-binding protein [Phreatobacter aquaticus]
MNVKLSLLAAGLALALGAPLAPAHAQAPQGQTLRYAFQGNLNTLDPYGINETTTLALQGNVYEGLTKRDRDLKIIPGLAERWEILDGGLRWRFHLRRGVKFQGGEDFTADDVVFSASRVRADTSDLRSRIEANVEVVAVDSHTVDFKLKSPNPILHYEWDTWYIMSKKWAEANNAVAPSAPAATTPGYAVLNANGTGPFRIAAHQIGVRTVFEKNPAWWGKVEHNLQQVIFTPITSAPTRVAALLSGEVDVIDPVPLQDIPRINASPNARVMEGPELRTIFLQMDQRRDELTGSSVKGKNPFKDLRVRMAFYQAIDMEAIRRQVMRGAATPSALLISPLLFERSGQFQRHPFSLDAANKLLDDAGYPRVGGATGTRFELTMDCPNDRYVNDGAICQAVTAMLARIGIKINLQAVPRAQFFAKVLASGGFNTSFYLLGWTPGSFDSWNVLQNLIRCRDDTGSGGRGATNLGGYCNPRVDALTDQILVEADAAKRLDLITQAYKIVHEEISHIPLHQQALAWGVSRNVELVQRADNQFLFHWVNKR